MWISNINKSITGSKHKIIRLTLPNFNSNFNFNIDLTLDLSTYQQLYMQLLGIGNTPLLTPPTTLYYGPYAPLASLGGYDASQGMWVSPSPASPMGLAINSDAVLQQRAENSKNNFEIYKQDIISQLEGKKKPKGKGLEDKSDLLENPFGLLSGLKDAKKEASNALASANKELNNATTKEGIDAAADKVAKTTQAEADAKKQLRLGRMAAAGAGLGMAGDIISSITPNRPEYEGPKGSITQGMDKAYDAIADGLSAIPVWGLLAGGIMKAGAGIGKVMGQIGGGTDGMCVCAGTRVVTASGKFINIEDLCLKDGIVGWGDGLTRILKIDVLLNPSQKQCVEIELDNGLTLRCSFDHPVLWSKNGRGTSVYLPDKSRQRIRDWEFKPAIEIEPGDYLGVTNDINIWGSKEMWEPYLVGLLIGDGYYRRSSVRLGTGDPETWAYIELHLVGKRTNYNDSYYNKEYREYVITNGRIHLEELGIHGQAKLEKRLPKDIHEYSKDSVCKLIAGLFDSDGSILCNKDGSDCKIVFYQSNIELIKQLKEQLLKLGIHSYLSYFKAATSIINNREVYSKEHFVLCIRDKLSLLKFCEQIPLNISYKKENLSKIQIFKSGGVVRGDRNRTGARAYRIKKVTPIGILVVYNLQTSNDHTYLANGIITHNTGVDAIMGSSFVMNLTPWGLANGFGGKTTDTFTKDEDAFALVGASYTGTNALADEALEHANKKYGLFSRGAMHDANALIAEAKRLQNVISNISDVSLKRNNLRSSMSAINSTNRTIRRQGGYNLSAMRSGRKGLRISPAMAGRIARVPILLLLGGGIQRKEEVIETPIEEIIEAPVTKVINTPVVEIQEYKLGGTLQLGLAILLVSPFGEEVQTYKDGGSLTKLRIIQLVNPIPENIESMQEGGEVTDMADERFTLIEEIDPTQGTGEDTLAEEPGIPLPAPIQPDVPTMRDGGEINIIPDGALHKELHHMEDPEGEWTRKGIPVVDAEGNLVAEIENSEIIIRKELIESMEEFTKKYYAKEATKEEKEQLALDAGITLVNEILYNTEDKTNKLL